MFAGHASTIVGTADPGSGNCFPFGCGYTGMYQQVYASSAFSGPLAITALEFFSTQSKSFNALASMDGGYFTISLSTTQANWNSLSSTFSTNLGSNEELLFSGGFADVKMTPDSLIFVLTDVFHYDPSEGNLLLTINAHGIADPLLFDASGYNNGRFNGNLSMGRVSRNVNVNGGYGLVTGFEILTPEPSTVLLLGIGLLAVTGFSRRLRYR